MGRPVKLADVTTDAAAGMKEALVVLPLGSIEQHSRHLPVGTDAFAAQSVADALEADDPERVLLLPPLWYGASDHHDRYAGTVSIGSPLLSRLVSAVITGVGRTVGVRRFLLLNGHGGNVPAMRVALELIAREAPEMDGLGLSYWDALFTGLSSRGEPYPEPMGHADRVETSLMLARGLVPSPAEAVAGSLTDGLPGWVFSTRGFHDRTNSGGVGDPRGASADEGRAFLAVAVEEITRLLTAYPWGAAAPAGAPVRSPRR